MRYIFLLLLSVSSYAVIEPTVSYVSCPTPGLPCNAAPAPDAPESPTSPTMPGNFTQSVATGNTLVFDFDPTGDTPITYSLSGTDSSFFTISSFGVIEFLSAPNFSSPQDSNGDNDYLVTITAINAGGSDSTDLIARVTDGSVIINTSIAASRTTCASPCPVVFSMENTTATGMDDHDVFGRELAFHWDFDTDESDTYGSLYDQTYTYTGGDTAYEVGHIPLVTKTFLCETGTCAYTVRVRAQDALGNFDDGSIVITVNSESAQWSLANTYCVSNTLNTVDDWTVYDKACPAGANKVSALPAADTMDGNLYLFRRGDVWGNIASTQGESNFKMGYFGNDADPKPEFDTIYHGAAAVVPDSSNVATTTIFTFTNESTVDSEGWPENIYIDGLKVGLISSPMSHRQTTLHDLDMDREAYAEGGSITISRGHTYCVYNPESVPCTKVPFSKGYYISSVDIVGSTASESNANAVNIVSIGFDMTNYFGIVNSRVRKVGEHNLRVMGFYRFSIFHNLWRGQHYTGGKQKLTIRNGMSSASASELQDGGWQSHANFDYANRESTTNFADVDGLTRQASVIAPEDPSNLNQFLHQSRFLVIARNQIGDNTALVATPGSTKYQTNSLNGSGPPNGDNELQSDVVLVGNTFENDAGNTSGDFGGGAAYSSCFDNTLTVQNLSIECMSPDPLAGDPLNGYEPPALVEITGVLAPTGS